MTNDTQLARRIRGEPGSLSLNKASPQPNNNCVFSKINVLSKMYVSHESN